MASATAELLPPTSAAWTSALERVRHDVYHRPGYVSTDAEVRGGRPVAFRYAEGGRVLLCPLVLRPVPGGDAVDALSPYGYSGPVSDAPSGDEEFWKRAVHGLVGTLAEHGVVSAFVRLHPLLDVPRTALGAVGEVVEHGETVSVDLTQPVEEIWRQTRRTHRNEVNRARRAGVEVVWDDWAQADGWLRLYTADMHRLEASADYLFDAGYLAALRERLGGHVHLATARHGGELVGGQVVLECDGTVQTHLSAMRADSRPLHPDKLLYDEVRRWAKARGDTVHHLGGGYGGESTSLFRYKAGFGAGRHRFATWRVVVDPPAYRRLAAAAGAAGTAGGGFFPAYRAPGAGR